MAPGGNAPPRPIRPKQKSPSRPGEGDRRSARHRPSAHPAVRPQTSARTR
ncbi:MAG: hypothetical protein HSCHL_0483 [Hydrogenibacillus schlegelii]|uniref:Uncharacterized protein n=1 Tax=Hydrogenibacillus schlegelii TaxID=1484 RepID=A0A2T5GDD7_HYDSH|nr:MAG: hypothetical protein HSCHL_0483 [Hydrogenibacillus schlegelii]